MKKFISKLGMGSKCLIFFILLCYMFTSENAFSHRRWKTDCAKVFYNQRFKCITIDFLFYDYCFAYDAIAYLQWCEFLYSGDDVEYTPLMRAATNVKKRMDQASIVMYKKKADENIQLLSGNNPVNARKWIDGTNPEIEVKTEYRSFRVGKGEAISNIAIMSVKWDVSKSKERIKYIKMLGLWCAINGNGGAIEEVYTLINVKSNSNRLDDSSVLKSEISNKLKVTKETDAINLKGAEPGEKIKVYTASGVEVKSIVANDDVVNIKLATNQIYFVKVRQDRYKITL